MKIQNNTTGETKKIWVKPTIVKISKNDILGGSKIGHDVATKSH